MSGSTDQFCFLTLLLSGPTQAPRNFTITRLDSGRVQMTWGRLVSTRGVAHDITYYRIEYRLTRTDVQNPPTIVYDTSSNDPSTIIDIPQDTATMQVVEGRIQGVTQVRREPDAFTFGPFSGYVTEDNMPTTVPPSELICTHWCSMYICKYILCQLSLSTSPHNTPTIFRPSHAVPLDPLPIVLGVVIPVVLIIVIAFIVVLMVLYWWDR